MGHTHEISSALKASTSSLGPVATFICSPMITLLLYYIYIRYFSALANIPGPSSAIISRFWLAHHAQKGDMHEVIPKLHAKYGKLVRVAPDEVSVADLNAIKTIYGPGSKFRKSDWYSVWQGTQKTDLFAERNIDVHSALKKNISRVYSMSALTALEKWVDDALECFIKRMYDQGSRTINLGDWLQLLAFDVIGEISFSKRFGFLAVGKDDGTFSKIETALRSLSWVGQLPWVFWLDIYCAPIIGHKLGLSLRHGLIRNYASREVDARKGRSTEHTDILGKLFEVQSQKPGELDDSAITSIATANIFAGSDTTAISLRAIIYFLLTNTTCLGRLDKEMQERKNEGLLSTPPKFAEVSSWPYLQACINESLRLHPAVGMSLPRVVPQGGTTIAGQKIPEGTVVGVNAWVVHRNATVFGEDVHSFKPERWMGHDKGDMERFLFAFGGGARLCIGKNISMMEMSKLIPLFFEHFEVELANPAQALRSKCA